MEPGITRVQDFMGVASVACLVSFVVATLVLATGMLVVRAARVPLTSQLAFMVWYRRMAVAAGLIALATILYLGRDYLASLLPGGQ